MLSESTIGATSLLKHLNDDRLNLFGCGIGDVDVVALLKGQQTCDL